MDHFLIPRDNSYVALMRRRQKERKKTEHRRQEKLEETRFQMNYIPHVSPQRPSALEEFEEPVANGQSVPLRRGWKKTLVSIFGVKTSLLLSSFQSICEI